METERIGGTPHTGIIYCTLPCPLVESCLTTSLPTVPVAPVTKIVLPSSVVRSLFVDVVLLIMVLVVDVVSGPDMPFFTVLNIKSVYIS